jgi:hypothetical protein
MLARSATLLQDHQFRTRRTEIGPSTRPMSKMDFSHGADLYMLPVDNKLRHSLGVVPVGGVPILPGSLQPFVNPANALVTRIVSV